MKNNFIDDLGITNLESGVISFGSTAGTGKTTLLSIIAGEFYHDGKNVLFLTDEVSTGTIIEKVRKSLIGLGPNLNVCSLNVKNLDYNVKTLEDFINLQFSSKNYDLIIIDTGRTLDFDLLKRLSSDKKCPIITSFQKSRDLTSKVFTDIPRTTLQCSDMLIDISVVEQKEPTIWFHLLYFLCFWLKKPVQPNRFLKILKNRFGKEKLLKANLDLVNVKITK